MLAWGGHRPGDAGIAGAIAGQEGASPFVAAPTEVEAAGIQRYGIHFIVAAAAHVTYPQAVRHGVQADAVGVCAGVGPDLRQCVAFGPHEGIVRRHGPAAVVLHVDAQQLAHAAVEVLRVLVGVALGATVADADVEVACFIEFEVAAFVLIPRLRDAHQHHFAVGVGHIGVAGHGEAGDVVLCPKESGWV
jgi:hypothetical protein